MRCYIYLFRHGQTTYNRDGRFTGWKDPRLTSLGVKQARAVARKLKGKKFDVAIHTRLVRSKQTLREVMKGHDECKKVLVDDRMIERNYGKLNGKTHEWFIDRIGRQLLKLDVEGGALENLSITDRKRLERFLGEKEYDLIHRGYNVPPPGGESFAMVEKRVENFISDLMKMIKREKVNVAISAHGNSIRLFRKIMEKAPVEKMTKWVIPYDDYFVYAVNVKE
jgi:2,3-bisphosphoglycerate-dependent phosphoglycerate mutase